MKTYRPLLRLTVTTALLVALVIVSAITFKAQAQRGDDSQAAAPAGQQAGYGKTTGLVGIVPGQTVRFAVWNKGEEAVLTRLQLVDEQGNVLFRCDGAIPPGKAEVESWPCCGGNVKRVELQAQFGTNEKTSIGLLMPTFQVIDNASGANSWMVGQEGFAEIRPIWVPSLVPPM